LDGLSHMSIRSFDAADLAPVLQLIHRTIDVCYSGVYPPRAVRFFKEFHSPDSILDRHAAGEVLVVEDNGELIATGSVVGSEITGVFVDPRLQRLGIGRRLMDDLEGIARAGGHASAEISVSLPSRRFYESRGYLVNASRSIDVGEGESLDYWAAEKALDESGS